MLRFAPHAFAYGQFMHVSSFQEHVCRDHAGCRGVKGLVICRMQKKNGKGHSCNGAKHVTRINKSIINKTSSETTRFSALTSRTNTAKA